jgi:hypothetical protein
MTPIPQSSEPIVSPNGLISRTWYEWFRQFAAAKQSVSGQSSASSSIGSTDAELSCWAFSASPVTFDTSICEGSFL